MIAEREPLRVTDHLYRDGGGFADWGRPTFRKFCGACAAAGRRSLTEADHDAEGYAARERLRDAAPALVEALEGMLALTRTGVHADDKSPHCCRICAAIVKAREALAAAKPPADDAQGRGEP